MANALPHRAGQAQEAADLGNDARKVGLRCLATSTLHLAQRAVSGALESTSQLSLRESVNDLRDIRSDPKFKQALDDDLSASQESVEELLLEAIEAGASAELEFQKTQIKGLQGGIDESDCKLIKGYPIQGHTASEMSGYMHDQLRYEVAGIVASPLVGDAEVRSIPQLLGATVTRFSERVSGGVEEAYYSGVQLATRMTAQAMSHAH